MSKIVEKKTSCQTSIWDTLKKATTKNSEWPDKVNIIKKLSYSITFN